VREALQLASLVTHAPGIKSSATDVLKQQHISLDTMRSVGNVGPKLCVQLLLRTTCLLTVVGKLTEQHRQGVVALLGGVNKAVSSTSSTSSGPLLLLPEPVDLVHSRTGANISLSEMLYTFLHSGHNTQASSLPSHLLLAFGEDQLPEVADYQKAAASVDIKERTGSASQLQTRLYELQAWSMFTSNQTIMKAHLGWMQETLLLVVSEVLNQPVPC
jgi:hypothetical protein